MIRECHGTNVMWYGWTYADTAGMERLDSLYGCHVDTDGQVGLNRSVRDRTFPFIQLKWWYGWNDDMDEMMVRRDGCYEWSVFTYDLCLQMYWFYISNIDTDGQYVWLEGFFYMDGLYSMNGLYSMAVLFLRMEFLYDRMVRIMVGMLWYGYRGTDFGRDCWYGWLDEFFSTARRLLYGCHSFMDGRMLQMSWWYVWTYYTAFMVIHM